MTPSLWRHRDFRLLFSAQIVSLLGSGVTTVALALLAARLDPGTRATALLGNALTLRILAFLVFSQPAGVIAERVSRKRVLVGADLARVALLALFPLVTTVWHVYLLVFVVNAVTAFFTPTFEASIPEVVGNEQYVRALALSRVAVDVEAVAAPALAAALVALVGARWIFWFDAATYLVSAGLVSLASIPPPAHTPSSSIRGSSLAHELAHGTRLLLRERSLRTALLASVAEATAGAAAIVATVRYVTFGLRRSESVSALAFAVLGLGSTMTALALGSLIGRYERGANDSMALHGRRHTWGKRALLSGAALLGAVLLPGLIEPALPAFLVLWLFNGAGQALIAIASSMLLAEHTRPGDRTRAYAAHFALTHLFWLVTYPAIGHAAARWGIPWTFGGAGLVCALAAAAAALVDRGPSEVHDHRAP